MKFDPAQMPKRWNHEEDDDPDVVFLASKGLPEPADAIRERLRKKDYRAR